MADEQMTPALRALVERHPPTNTEQLWDEISEAAWKLPRSRGDAELPGERVARLRERLHGELIAFHQRLPGRVGRGVLAVSRHGLSVWKRVRSSLALV